MAIEGPLRELGIHDVFQLLDLSRKTGTLTITSSLRDNQGTVYFDSGAVIYADIRSNPHPLGELLLRSGKISEGDLARARDAQTRSADTRRLGEILVEREAITRKELERQVRFQVEEVVFELLSWSEGFFRFEEGSALDAPAEASIRISTESLLMEGARRIDEWSRIEGKVPHLGVVPVLAAVRDSHPALLDLLPNEWEVLAEIDGERDLRAIASNLARSDFDVARIVFGLLSTGIVEIDEKDRAASAPAFAAAQASAYVEQAQAALRSGDCDGAVTAARMALAVSERSVEARLVLARALACSGRHEEASAELAAALEADALNAAVHLEMGHCAARKGDLEGAAAHWERYLRLAPNEAFAPRVRTAVENAVALQCVLQEHMYV
jgi:Predicted N-acetylglucosaminyl transferase